MKVDVCCGLAWGDEGKGKIVSQLSKNYDYVCRWSGEITQVILYTLIR